MASAGKQFATTQRQKKEVIGACLLVQKEKLAVHQVMGINLQNATLNIHKGLNMTTNELVQFLEYLRSDLAEEGRSIAPAMLDAAIARLKEQEVTIQSKHKWVVTEVEQSSTR
jgi:hypothetical protein